MKKSILLLGGMAMMMTACSSDEVIETANTRGIGFESFVNKSNRATTSTDLTNSTLTGFNVWGVTYKGTEAPTTIFLAQDVNKNGTAWEYTPLRYWLAGNTYRFSAVAPQDAAGLTVVQNTDPIADITTSTGGLEMTFDNKAANAAVDLCYASNYVAAATADQAPVELNFSHMLSRVKFTFKNTFTTQNSLIKISDIQITDATAAATINKHAGETAWTAKTDAPGTFAVTFTNVNTSANSNGIPGIDGVMETEHQYLISLADEASYHVSFKVELLNYDPTTNKYTATATYNHANVALPATTFKSNFSYNFVAEINAKTIDPEQELNPIQFTPSVGEWNDFNDSNIDMSKPGAGE